MNFAAQAVADLDTMINMDEFAILLSINGAAAVRCILDEALKKDPEEGVREWDGTLTLKETDLSPPVPDQRLELGSYTDQAGTVVPARSAIVVHTAGQHGLQTIYFRWFES